MNMHQTDKPNELEGTPAQEIDSEASKGELIPVTSLHAQLTPMTRRELLQKMGFSSVATALLLAVFPEPSQALSSRAVVGVGRSAVLTAAGATVAQPLVASSLRIQGTPKIFQLPHWGDGAAWDAFQYSDTIQAMRRKFPKTNQSGDLDGDGRDEMIARSPAGILAQKYDPEVGQWKDLIITGAAWPEWSDAKEWSQEMYFRTIQMADVDGDGRAELIGRSSEGIQIWKFSPSAPGSYSGTWADITPAATIWSDADGWGSDPSYFWTIQCADINGDGRAEIIGRAPDTDRYGGGMQIWNLNENNELMLLPKPTDPISQQPLWNNAAGWTHQDNYLTIQCADIDGDQRAELIGRDKTGIQAWKFNPDPSDPTKLTGTWVNLPHGPTWSNANGYTDYSVYCTIQSGDINGDGKAELIARSGTTVQIWEYNATSPTTGTWQKLPDGPAWSNGNGWTQQYYAETIQCADLDGDGTWELLGRAGDGLYAWKYDKKTQQWIQLEMLPEFNNANSWDEIQHYRTIQSARLFLPGDRGYSGAGTHAQMAILGRSKLSMQTWAFVAPTTTYPNGLWTTTNLAAFPTFTGNQGAVYTAISSTFVGADDDLRNYYTTDQAADQLSSWRSDLYTQAPTSYDTPPNLRDDATLPKAILATLPPGITQDDINAVAWQIWWELFWVEKVNDWFFGGEDVGGIKGLISDITTGNSLSLAAVADILSVDPTSSDSVSLSTESLVAAIVSSILAVVASVATGGVAAVAIASAVAGAVSAGVGFAASDADGAFKAKLSDLQIKLSKVFSDTLNANTTTGTAVLTDYSLLKIYGENTTVNSEHSGHWNFNRSEYNQMRDAGWRGYALNAFQALIPTIPWYIWFLDPEGEFLGQPTPPPSLPPPYGDGTPAYPPEYSYKFTYIDSDGKSFDNVALWISEAYSSFNADREFPLEGLSALFDAPVDGVWEPLGVPLMDFFEGLNGWPRMTWWNQQRMGPDVGGAVGAGEKAASPPRPVALEADVRLSVKLWRDMTTNEIVADITSINRGLTPAANVEITNATLNNRQSLTSLPQGHRRLKTGVPSLTRVYFANQSGNAVLRISGKHKDGVFGTSLRVKLP